MMESVKDQKGPRDPGRIPELISWLAIYWKRHPDLRLGELIVRMAQTRNDDAFHLADSELMEAIKKELLMK
jgi:uncharacterized protein YihD (DUF1040 family)